MHTLAERVKRGEISSVFTFALYLPDKTRSDIFDSQKSEHYFSVLHLEALGTDIDMRRHDFYAELVAFSYILRDLGRIIQHAAEQSRHKLAGIVTL